MRDERRRVEDRRKEQRRKPLVQRLALEARTRITEIVHMTPPDLGELFSSMNLLLWGLWMCLPGRSLLVGDNTEVILSLVPEWSLGIPAIMLGAFQFLAVCFGPLKTRFISAWLARASFSIIFLSYFLGDPFSASVPLYGILAFINGWLCFRLKYRIQAKKLKKEGREVGSDGVDIFATRG